VKDLLIKAKIVFDRGKEWIGYINFLMIVFITVASMKTYSTFSFLSSTYWLVAILVLSFLMIGVIGWLEIKLFGSYQREAEIRTNLNPVYQKILSNQEKILKELKSPRTGK
jgi:hypothetical protein